MRKAFFTRGGLNKLRNHLMKHLAEIRNKMCDFSLALMALMKYLIEAPFDLEVVIKRAWNMEKRCWKIVNTQISFFRSINNTTLFFPLKKCFCKTEQRELLSLLENENRAYFDCHTEDNSIFYRNYKGNLAPSIHDMLHQARFNLLECFLNFALFTVSRNSDMAIFGSLHTEITNQLRNLKQRELTQAENIQAVDTLYQTIKNNFSVSAIQGLEVDLHLSSQNTPYTVSLRDSYGSDTSEPGSPPNAEPMDFLDSL